MKLNSGIDSSDDGSLSQSLCSATPRIVILTLLVCIASSSIVFTLTSGLQFLTFLEKVASKFDLYCPEISIVDGEATIKEKQPYFVETPQDLNLTAIIDTRKNPDPNPLSHLKKDNTGMLLLRHSLVIKNREEISTIKLNNFPDMTLNSQTISSEIGEYRSSIILSIFLGSLIYFGIGKIVQTLISALSIQLVTRYLAIPFSFGKGFKLASFVLVPCTLLDIILISLNLLGDSQLYIYLGCYAAVLFVLVKDLTASSIQQKVS